MKKFISNISCLWLFSSLIIALLPPLIPGAQASGYVKSAILYNLTSGKILFERNADAAVAPASLTKIMTMFLALDAIKNKKASLHQKVRISRGAATVGGSVMRVGVGEKVPLVRLLAGMTVASGNDAATAVADHIGGNQKNFVALMNRKARALNMRRTQFKNPTGLPAAGQKTTARDLLLLCAAYLKAHPQARRFHSMAYFMHKGTVVRNTNPLLGRIQGVDGLKTGWTVASGYNLIVTATRGKIRLLAIVLGGASKEARESMAIKLIEAGFRNPANAAAVRQSLGYGTEKVKKQ